jgi:hypothetical protein
MTYLRRILTLLINGSQSSRDRAALREHRDIWLGRQSRKIAKDGRHYSF